MANDFEFEDKKITICELLKSKRLPIVVRVFEEERTDDDLDYYHGRIAGKTKVFIQKTLKLKYALIKVLRYYDNDVIQKKNGPEYVLEHDTYVGKQFYIPVKYNRSFKFAYRPGSRRRYATISQVLEELPRYISLGEVTEAISSSGQKVPIPAKTKLELRQKFNDPFDGSVLLSCSDGENSFSFSNKDRINCTEIEDNKTYHLFQNVRNKMLPKVILFQNAAPEDCVLMDSELNSALLTSVEGPLELLGFEDIEVAVGWVRDKEAKTYNTVLIPSGLWNELIVQERCLYSERDQINYIEKKYKLCGNSIQFLETCLYWLYPDKSKITWLRSPDFYKRTVRGNHMFEPITTYFQDSTDDEDDKEYDEIFEPPPPLPERKPTIRDIHEGNMRAKEKKSLFRMVHKELFDICKHVHLRHPKDKGRPPKVHKHQKNVDETGVSSNVGFNIDTTDEDLNLDQSAEVKHTYDYPDMDSLKTPCQKRPLPKLPGTKEMTQFTEEEKPTVQNQTDLSEIEKKKHLTPKYISVVMQNASHLFRDNLTEEDFFKYTVIEAAQCFKYCGLSKFADECLKGTIDGSFFRNFDFDNLRKEPFNLSSFQILKVKKMIFNGWRPKVYT